MTRPDILANTRFQARRWGLKARNALTVCRDAQEQGDDQRAADFRRQWAYCADQALKWARYHR